MTEAEIEPRTGAFVVAMRREGLGGVVRLIEYEGGEVRWRGGSAHLTTPRASVVWCALYSPGVLANRWEPYDQPSAALYMPHGFAAFERVDNGLGWTTLMQRRSDVGSLRADLAAHDDGLLLHARPADARELRESLSRALAWIGVSREVVEGCCDTIVSRTSEALARVAA